jgi:hypothetical protein
VEVESGKGGGESRREEVKRGKRKYNGEQY